MRTHPELVSDLCKPGEEIQSTLTPEKCHLLHMAMGIAGEAGEILDVIKKHVIYDQEIDMNHALEELGDIEFFVEGLRQGLGLEREDILDHNIFKLEKRYGQKYSDKAAKERADKADDDDEYYVPTVSGAAQERVDKAPEPITSDCAHAHRAAWDTPKMQSLRDFLKQPETTAWLAQPNDFLDRPVYNEYAG